MVVVVSRATNRKDSQTKFLLNLLDNDFEKLLLLETKLKNNFIFPTPSTKEEIEVILNMGDGSNWFDFELKTLYV